MFHSLIYLEISQIPDKRYGKLNLIFILSINSLSRQNDNTMRISLRTWGGKTNFEYEGDPLSTGTVIYYGKDCKYKVKVSEAQYLALIARFSGQSVPAGTSRDNPPSNSLGYWLQEKVTKTALASYIGSILVNHGLAEKHKDQIVFKKL